MIQCKICNSSQITDINDSSGKLYHYCQNCQYIFLNSQFILLQEDEKKQYDFHNNDINNSGYVQMFETFFTQIFKHMSNVNTILDFGCGPGPVMAKLLKQRGYEVSLYDKYFYDKKQNLQKMYDLIISTEVFEHLSDPIATLQILLPQISNNGYLAVMTSFHSNDIQKFKNWFYKVDPTHIGFFNAATFSYIAKRFNLKLLYTDNKKVVIFQK